MSSRHERWPVASYVVITFAFSWTAWTLGTLAENQALTFASIVVGGFGPMVGALALVYREDRRVRDWLRDLLRVRGPLRWYAVALAVPLALPAALTAYLAATGTTLDPGVLPDRVLGYLGSLVFVFFLGGGQEEFGWRGYMLPRLLDRTTPLRASLVIGVVWAVWHLPLYVLPDGIYAGRPFSTYVPLVVVLACVFTWLYEAADRRVLVVMVLHAGVNSVGVLVPVSAATLQRLSGHANNLVSLAAMLVVLAALLAARGWPRATDGRERGTGGI